MTCEDCIFWLAVEEEPKLAVNNGTNQGVCRRYPPFASPMLIPEQNKFTHEVRPQRVDFTTWPVTMSNQWCGEAKEKTQ